MDNIDKLIKAVELPEKISDKELQAILSDPEAMQLYRLLCAARSEKFLAGTDLSPSEIETQWQKFMRKKHRNLFRSWFRHRKVAAVAAFLVVSCSIIMVGVSLTNQKMRDSGGSQLPYQQAATDSLPEEKGIRTLLSVPNDTIIIFEDEKLDRVLSKIAPYYNVRVDLLNPQSKEVRLFLKWDSTTPLEDLIDHLNSFDRINLLLKENVITDY